MHIKKMTLENFRCFEHLDIEFPQDYAVLIGTNGAGMSFEQREQYEMFPINNLEAM